MYTLESLKQNQGYKLRHDGLVEIHTPAGYIYYWEKLGNGLYHFYAAAFNSKN